MINMSDMYVDPSMPQVYTPFMLDAMESVPPLWATIGWNLGRTSRTITHGPIKTRLPHKTAGGKWSRIPLSGEGGFIRQGTRQTFGPRHLRRLSRAANIDPTAYGEGSKIYSPFNFLAHSGNLLFKKRDTPINIPLIGSKANALLNKIPGSMGNEAGTVPFSPGTFGRVMTMRDITKMSNKKFAKALPNILGSVADISNTKGIAKVFEYVASDVGKWGAASRVGSTITGSVSGRFAGYVHGASAYKKATSYAGKEALRDFRSAGNRIIWAAGKEAGDGFFGQGVRIGLKAAEEGKFLAKIAPFTGTALKGLNVASYITIAHDVALGVGKMAGAVGKLTMDAGKSVVAPLNKPLMGAGFKDNAVAASSRQRGVMAIQNSQLNARSILGSEASMIHARYG